MLILNYFTYTYFKLFITFKIETKNAAPDVGLEHVIMTLSVLCSTD